MVIFIFYLVTKQTRTSSDFQRARADILKASSFQPEEDLRCCGEEKLFMESVVRAPHF